MKKLEENKICPFGIALYKVRKEKNISSARLSMKSETFSSHLLHIEKGIAQPSVMVAFRLVLALNLDLSVFFKDLASSQNLIQNDYILASNDKDFDLIIDNILIIEPLTAKNIFGLLYKEIRKYYKVTQKEVASISGYAIRNIQKVENEEQNPSVMNALAIICAVGQKANIDIGIFFKAYQYLVEKLEIFK